MTWLPATAVGKLPDSIPTFNPVDDPGFAERIQSPVDGNPVKPFSCQTMRDLLLIQRTVGHHQ